MNITVQIGLTPELEKTLTNLFGAFIAGQAIQPVQNVAPVQQPIASQPAPIQQPPQGVPTAVPTQQAPVQQQAPIQQAPPAQQQAPVQQPQGVPTSAPAYTMDQLAVAATQLMDAGRQQDLLNLLASFNTQSLMQVPQEQYGAFATKLREMGAKI